jgi:hypothetical protein
LEAAMKRFTEGFSSADFARAQDLARTLQVAPR